MFKKQIFCVSLYLKKYFIFAFRYIFRFNSILMSFEKRMAELRKQGKISQEELSKKIGVHQNVIGRYERGEAKPSIEIASAIADVLGVSLDYLTGKTDFMADETITERIITIQKLPEQDREHILFALDAMIRDAKARAAYK